MTQSLNPLRAFFRQPAIYIRLPSDGQFWPPGSLDMPVNRELPILPMTAMDEITYRTPDALFNGAAIVSVVQSCIPSIKNAWHMPNCDLNTILTAIRIASYGAMMEVDTTCEKCSTENNFELDLKNLLDTLDTPDFSESVKHGDLEIYFQSVGYEKQTEINLLQFEQQRVLAQLPNSGLTEEQKTKMLNDAIQQITKITVKAIRSSIVGIKTPQALVSEPDFIEDFLMNCDRQLYGEIRDHAIKIRAYDEFKPIKMKCSNCEHEYEQNFTLDTANFFGAAS